MPIVQNTVQLIDSAKDAASLISSTQVLAVGCTATLVGVGWYGMRVKRAYTKEMQKVHTASVSAIVRKKFDRPVKADMKLVNLRRTFGPLQSMVDYTVFWSTDWLPVVQYSLANPEVALARMIPFSGHSEMSSVEDKVAATLIAGVPDLLCRSMFGQTPVWLRVPGIVAVSSHGVRSWVMGQPIIGDAVRAVTKQAQRIEDSAVGLLADAYKAGIVGSLKGFEESELGSDYFGPHGIPQVKWVVGTFIAEKGERFAEDMAVKTFRGLVSVMVEGLVMNGVATALPIPQPFQVAFSVFAKVGAGGAYQSRREIALRAGLGLFEYHTNRTYLSKAILYIGQFAFWVQDKVVESELQDRVEVIEEDDTDALLDLALDDFAKGETGKTVGESSDVEDYDFYAGNML